MNVKYGNLRAEMSRANIGNYKMAELIGITPQCFYKKLNGGGIWNLKEMAKIQKILQEATKLKLPLDYLFEGDINGD